MPLLSLPPSNELSTAASYMVFYCSSLTKVLAPAPSQPAVQQQQQQEQQQQCAVVVTTTTITTPHLRQIETPILPEVLLSTTITAMNACSSSPQKQHQQEQKQQQQKQQQHHLSTSLLLFKKQQQQLQHIHNKTTTTVSKTTSNTTTANFWHEDNWTEVDVQMANEHLLLLNGSGKAKRVSSSCYLVDESDNNEHDDDDNVDDDEEEEEESHDDTPFSEEYVQRQRLRYHHHNSSNNNNNNNNNESSTFHQQAWNSFYQRHQVGFFRDRHYLPKEFPEEFQLPSPTTTSTSTTNTTTTTTTTTTKNTTWIEMGCGVGNAILPFLEESSLSMVQGWTIHAIDLSPVAIDLLQRDERWINTLTKRRCRLQCDNDDDDDESSSSTEPSQQQQQQQQQLPRLFAHVCDVSCQPLPSCLMQAPDNITDTGTAVSTSAAGGTGVADIMTLLFCLSAIAPDRIPYAIQNMTKCLKVGGVILFRDYGRYDQAQLQLAKQQQQLQIRYRRGRGRRRQMSKSSQPPAGQQQGDVETIAEHAVALDGDSYIKQDGTACYYFTVEEIQQLFEHYGGCQVLQLQYLQRIYINRATQEPRRRVWIQGRFQKVTKQAKKKFDNNCR